MRVVKVVKSAVLAKDARSPGYAASVSGMATSETDTHYVVPRDAYMALVAATRRPCRKPVALGDAVERMLTRLGITKERVQAWTRKPCNCPARQRWLNQWGYEKQAQLERVLRKAARWYGIS